jgi:Fe-S cluster assembly protein SufD
LSAAVDSLLRLRERFANAGPDWLVARRAEALAAFTDAGLPTRRLEAWKSTNLAPLAALEFARLGPAPGGEVASTLSRAKRAGAEASMVFVDGRFDPAASSLGSWPTGVRVRPLAEVLRDEPDRLRTALGRLADPKRSALVALQTACLEDGAVVELAAGARCEAPIRIRFVATAEGARPSASFARLLVLAGERSEATILTEFVTPREAIGFTDHVAELALAREARIELVGIQAEAKPRIHFASVHAELEQGARFDSHVVSLADGLVRSELEVRLLAPGAETTMNGFFLGRAQGHVDHFTTVDHAAPHCTSAQEYRGVLADRAKGVFRGRVVVRPGAQKTDARQSNPNLLLSPTAEIDTRPQLEIYADDVKASHGSTIGQLDADALFFLRARGIGESEARVMLTRAFATAAAPAIREPGVREEATRRIDEALDALEATRADGGPR